MKKFFCIILGLTILVGIVAYGQEAVYQLLSSNTTILIGEEKPKFSNPILTTGDTIYVPLRELSEFLKYPITWNSEKDEVSLEIYKKKLMVGDESELVDDLVPNESIAYDIGKLLLEHHAGRSLEYETDKRIYFLNVAYVENYNAWRVDQTFKLKSGVWTGTGMKAPTIYINKSTGEILYINIYSDPLYLE